MLTWQSGFFQRCIWGLVNDDGGGWGGGGGRGLSAFFGIFEDVLTARLGTNDEWGTEILMGKKLVHPTTFGEICTPFPRIYRKIG